jgi:hypothetical protein
MFHKQYRLLPALAVCYAWRNFSTTFFVNLAEFLAGIFSGDKSERQVIKVLMPEKERRIISISIKLRVNWGKKFMLFHLQVSLYHHGQHNG